MRRLNAELAGNSYSRFHNPSFRRHFFSLVGFRGPRMNLAHLHLLLNHFPTLGFGGGFGLFLLSFFLKNDVLKQLGLGVLFFTALVAIPVYQTGVAAAETISALPGVSTTLITAHEDA